MESVELETIRSCSITFYARGGPEPTLMEPENAAVQFNKLAIRSWRSILKNEFRNSG